MSIEDKYLKYKTKYLQLKKYLQIGGFFSEPRLRDPTKADQFNFWERERYDDKGQIVNNLFPYVDIGRIRFIVPYKFVLREDPNRNVLCVQSFIKDPKDDKESVPTLFMVYASNSECNVWRYMSYTYDLEIEQKPIKIEEDEMDSINEDYVITNFDDIFESTTKILINNNDSIIKIKSILENPDNIAKFGVLITEYLVTILMDSYKYNMSAHQLLKDLKLQIERRGKVPSKSKDLKYPISLLEQLKTIKNYIEKSSLDIDVLKSVLLIKNQLNILNRLPEELDTINIPDSFNFNGELDIQPILLSISDVNSISTIEKTRTERIKNIFILASSINKQGGGGKGEKRLPVFEQIKKDKREEKKKEGKKERKEELSKLRGIRDIRIRLTQNSEVAEEIQTEEEIERQIEEDMRTMVLTVEEEYPRYIQNLTSISGVTTQNQHTILNKGINYTTTTSICIELQIFLTKILFNFDLYNQELTLVESVDR